MSGYAGLVELSDIVIDTNVVIAALRSRRGASFALLELIDAKMFRANLSHALASEYQAVGMRLLPSMPFGVDYFNSVLDFTFSASKYREIYYRWRPCLPDPSDDMVLELAIAAGGATTVTFNVKDFRGADRFGVRVCTPGDFLKEI